ncbi:hypothetical protein ACJRO7_035847 [Eucalyptus globulus]|uniref:Josephin-like protein n=1 Tax=Eucalyptus globulus TaxID=34317 RepID=A0ABD3JCE1_EUCGL
MEKQLRGEEGEEQCSPRKAKAQCIPRLRVPIASSSSCSARSHRFAPSTLLERFREAVFRLMMLSALSKSSPSPPPPPPPLSRQHRPYYPVNDPHHSEALADCIEFINRKKKASGEDDEATTISGATLDDPAEMVMPVPVM